MDQEAQEVQVTQEEKVVSPTPDVPKAEGEKQTEVTTPSQITNGETLPKEPPKTEECKLVQSESKSEPEPVVESPKPVAESKPVEVVEPKITAVPEIKPIEPELKPVEAESRHVEAESKPVEAQSKPVEVESKPAEVEQKPVEVDEHKHVVELAIAEEPKEVRSEEIPPPLPTSNPPSPVTVFAESTMAEVQVLAPVVETIPEPVSDSLVCEKVVEHSAPVVSESSPLQLPIKEAEPVAQSSPVIEHNLAEVVQDAPPSPVTEQILNADSLPDISTESLPSLPEPLSESLPEPMSLPPVDCVPEPITKDATEPEPIPNIPLESEAVLLTNGEANGLPSPIHNGTNDDTDVTPPPNDIDRPLKQVIPASETIQNERQDGDKLENIEPTPVKVEE